MADLPSLLASCHLQCLPHTPSAQAGAKALAALYQTLLKSSVSKVVYRLVDQDRRCIGFASGTLDRYTTQRGVLRQLPPGLLLSLLLRNLLQPTHLLAQWRWRHCIPQAGSGYILTIGTDPTFIGDKKIAGRMLLAELEAFFRERDCQQVWVDTESSNRRAIDFYLKNLYTIVREDHGHALLSKILV